jgi:hypothetical protein
MEASAVAADVTASRALSRGGMTARDALRYVEFELDTLFYVLSTDEDGEDPGQDVADFIATYNGLALETGAELLSARTLKRQAIASLANPMLAYAAWSVGRYLATGADDASIPTINVGGVRYLPLMRYRLTPFGTEWALVNEFGGRMRPTQVELRFGRAPNERPWGVAVRHREIPAWREWTIDLGVAAWQQSEFGGYVSGRAQRPIVPVWFSSRKATLIVDVGVKSDGYLAGEPLGAGPVIRAGIGLPLAR